jgi:phage gpG-like protein
VKVGVLASKGAGDTHNTDGGSPMTLVEIAAVHEFGSRDGRIPERSFLRSTFLIRRVNALAAMQTKLAKAIVTDGMDPSKALAILGAWGAAEVKNTFTEIDIPPPLAESTIARKGSSRPLVDTGLLKNSISYEVVDNDSSTEVTHTTMPSRGG